MLKSVRLRVDSTLAFLYYGRNPRKPYKTIYCIYRDIVRYIMAKKYNTSAIKIYSQVVPGYTHWAAPEDIQPTDRMKVPGEGIWVCMSVTEGVARFYDPRHGCARFLRLMNPNLTRWSDVYDPFEGAFSSHIVKV